MSRKSLILALFGTVAVAAAASGGFLALRMNGADQALATVGAPNAPAPVAQAAVETKAPAAPVPTQPVSTPSRAQVRSVPPAPALAPPTTGREDRARPAISSIQSQPITQAAPPPSAAPAPVPTTVSSQASTSLQPIVPPVLVPAATAPPTPDVPPAPAADLAQAVAPTQAARFEELVLAIDSVIGIRLESTISSQNARIEDKVTAVVTRDVTVAGHTAIPAGTRLEGVVQAVEPGGKFKTQARLGIRFTKILMADNARLPIQTETIWRDGESPSNEATSKVGAGAVVGSILGALIGGKKGAAIGAGAGAAGSAAAVAAGDPNAALMVSGTLLTVRLTAPATITIEKHD